ncbi:MAG: hypothetical protein FJ288_00825 [Planctomycetes bacterium]|nr:hypothetical protein [Planctomycetota bacterium]
MKFEVFGKVGCAMCESTKDKLRHLVSKAAAPAQVAFVDMNTIEGRAEGAFRDVRKVPTTILWSETGSPLARWDGHVPPSVEVQAFLGAARAAPTA